MPHIVPMMIKYTLKALCILVLSLSLSSLYAQKHIPKRTPYVTQIYTLRIETPKQERRIEKKIRKSLGKIAKKVDAVSDENRLYITFDRQGTTVEAISRTLKDLHIDAQPLDRSRFTLKQPCCR